MSTSRKVTYANIVLLIATCAAPATTSKILSTASSDEFPPDDISEDDLVETGGPGVPERGIRGVQEVKADFSLIHLHHFGGLPRLGGGSTVHLLDVKEMEMQCFSCASCLQIIQMISFGNITEENIAHLSLFFAIGTPTGS